MTMTISMPWLIQALTDERERERIDEGLVAAIRQFYDDYTDADSVIGCDPSFYRALEKISQYGIVQEIDELIQRAQDELTDESGRKFKRAVNDEEEEEP